MWERDGLREHAVIDVGIGAAILPGHPRPPPQTCCNKCSDPATDMYHDWVCAFVSIVCGGLVAIHSSLQLKDWVTCGLALIAIVAAVLSIDDILAKRSSDTYISQRKAHKGCNTLCGARWMMSVASIVSSVFNLLTILTAQSPK